MFYFWRYFSAITVIFCVIMPYTCAADSDIFYDYLKEQPRDLVLERSIDDELDLCNACLSDIKKTLPPSVIVDLLTHFGALTILQEDFFLHTNPLTKRSLLDSPLFEYCPFVCKNPWRVDGSVFYNKINHCNFTAKSTHLCSYIALSSPTLLGSIVNAIEQINEVIPNFSDLNIAHLFSLFQKMRVEERNLGFMFSGTRCWEHSYLRFIIPLFYHQRNLFLTLDQLDEVANELGEGDSDFQKKHVISDRFGLGDIRLELGFTVVEKTSIDLFAGLQATLPIAFTMGTDFYGSTFCKPNTYPDVPFDTLYQALEDAVMGNVTPNEQIQVVKLARNFLIGALDRFSANIIDDPLGNKGHFGLGVFAYMRTPLTTFIQHHLLQKCWWYNRASLEFFFPNNEKRFFIANIDHQGFASRNFTSSDETIANDNLNFLQNELISRVNLLALDTRVTPGFILRWTSSFMYERGPWQSQLGTNVWIQGDEQQCLLLKKPHCVGPTIDQINALNTKKALLPLAYQLKIFGALSYNFEYAKTTWSIGLNADITTLKRGVGSDYTLAFTVAASF